MQIVITTEALEGIDRSIGSRSPESGGFLFCSQDGLYQVIEDFAFDFHGRTGAAAYYPSQDAPVLIDRIERQRNLALCGVVHSHPGSMNYPSSSDSIAMDSLLALNPQLPFILAPIVTLTVSKRAQKHEIRTKHCSISFFYKDRGSSVLPVGAITVISKSDLEQERIKWKPSQERTQEEELPETNEQRMFVDFYRFLVGTLCVASMLFLLPNYE